MGFRAKMCYNQGIGFPKGGDFLAENIFYRARRAAAALFTRRCVCCGRSFSGRQCVCSECAAGLVPADEPRGNFAACASYLYEGAARDVMLRFKFGEAPELCADTLADWLCDGFDMAATAFAHYEDTPTDEREIVDAIQKRNQQSVAPDYDPHTATICSPIFRTFTNATKLAAAIVQNRQKFAITYPTRNELQAYCEFTPWSPANAWDAFAENGNTRHYLKGSNDYVFFLWQYFIEFQTEWCFTFGDMLESANNILPHDPSKWFMERVTIADPDERATVLTMAKRMFYTTRLWSLFGRTPLDIIAQNATTIDTKLADFIQLMQTDADYDVPQEPQKIASAKIERNSPCPCGSGLKYKKCCGKSK